MIYLVSKWDPLLMARPDVFGQLFTFPRRKGWETLETGWWGGDNGCFLHPERFDADRFIDWAASLPRKTCLFVCAPDVVGDAEETLRLSMPVLSRLRNAGVPAALVGQDGLERLTVPWDDFDALFIGGSTKWKLASTTQELAREAKARGKHLHMGRVNSYKRLRAAALLGYDSADGTTQAFAPTRERDKMLGWFTSRQA